ncbi:MAG: hypothetical protein JWQ90_450 [Hydrocarboniphaga sp.]|uniref:hypothetical protein n=1 Tax=Hydrocarboniphaga sp. TaxID=2033016 RepID=UPI00261936DD|nr:hypothetical protein [Hydrocarboniphaga sp.]MDB5968000.1 hypothetical protein [Hydrocarboniphaga sp.]
MSNARRQLLDLILDPDQAYDQPAAEIRALQLEAAQELFAQRREQIPLVAKRAEDAGISAIRSFDDLVPLLFAHTVYKSYPASFFEQGRWDRMLQWLNTLSVADVSGVDVAGVRNVDDWLERLWDAGHAVIATSGTTGKCSFLNHTMGDREMKARHARHTVAWPFARASSDRPVFWLGPIKGRQSSVEAAIANAKNWGRAGDTYALSDEPLLISELSEMAAMRNKMAKGSATPDEIAAFELKSLQKSQRMRAGLLKLTDRILERRHEPIFLTGLWSQHMMIIERARELGVGDGEFHPQSVISAGGGIKGVALPADYQQQVERFYGKVIRFAAYGMTEMAQTLPRCEAGRYHIAPGLIALPLDASGEKRVKPEDAGGQPIEARFAFLDLLYEGRWGGLITGDKVAIDFSERCACGRHGPTLLDTIGRYTRPGQDDHIGCAGTIDAYIRGAVNA